MLARELAVLKVKDGVEVAWDEVPGAPLDPEHVHAARAVEMQSVEDMDVYTRVARSELDKEGTLPHA